jgi:D-aminopeptidase
MKCALLAAVLSFAFLSFGLAQKKPRARDLGIPFEGTPGPFNAITDVKGVEVGHTTLISGSGKLQVGVGPVRTGVTAIHPRGKQSSDPVFGAWFPLNGNGDMTGTHWLDESGFLEGPIMLTNTHSVGVVRDAVVGWQARNGRMFQSFTYPVVAETYDGGLNDINGFHVKDEHVVSALENASSGPVPEGNVGGGTGMICFGFKGGIGTASRTVKVDPETYTVGVLVQSNFGSRHLLRIAGVPVGLELANEFLQAGIPELPEERASIIIVVATDAPLLPQQIKRLARRAGMGLARTGSVAENGSGDLFIAFSTANPGAAGGKGVTSVRMLRNREMNPLFEATVQATEEAITNVLVAAETMTGINDRKMMALPHDRVRQILKKYNRLVD